ncbi:alpha/beta hydrolase [Streptomyces sp. NPDC002521]
MADAFHKADKDSSFAAPQYLPHAFRPGKGAPLDGIKVPPPTPQPLVINSTDGPRTGIVRARTVSQRLGAKPMPFKGHTHVATQGGVECAQRAAARYLVTRGHAAHLRVPVEVLPTVRSTVTTRLRRRRSPRDRATG